MKHVEIQFTLNGDVPSKKNSKRIKYRQGRPTLLPSEAYEVWHEEAWVEITQKKIRKFKDPKWIEIVIFPSTNRKADLTNKAESVMDLLVDTSIIEDDNWFVIGKLHLEFGGVDKINPRVVITIR